MTFQRDSETGEYIVSSVGVSARGATLEKAIAAWWLATGLGDSPVTRRAA